MPSHPSYQPSHTIAAPQAIFQSPFLHRLHVDPSNRPDCFSHDSGIQFSSLATALLFCMSSHDNSHPSADVAWTPVLGGSASSAAHFPELKASNLCSALLRLNHNHLGWARVCISELELHGAKSHWLGLCCVTRPACRIPMLPMLPRVCR